MTSKKQIEANRKNALKGGVKTSIGKQASSQNSLKHGVLSLQVLEDEKSKYFELVKRLFENYQPSTIVEQVLTERMALHIVQLERLNTASNQFWKSCINPEIRESQFDLSVDVVVNSGYRPTIDLSKMEVLMSVFNRYQTRLENQLLKIDKSMRA